VGWAFQHPGKQVLYLFPNDGEVALNQQVKDLIQKLGEAIHESVSESDQISTVVREIREQGFDVLLMLEATIGLNEVEEEAEAEAETIDGESGADAASGPFTRNDLTFLKSLRISTEETERISAESAESTGPNAGPDAAPAA
jgi:uncharacterized protein (UPF0335 family)